MDNPLPTPSPATAGWFEKNQTMIWGLLGVVVALLLYRRFAAASASSPGQPAPLSVGGSLSGGGGGASATGSDPASALALDEAAQQFAANLQNQVQQQTASNTLTAEKNQLDYLFPSINPVSTVTSVANQPPALYPGGSPNGPPVIALPANHPLPAAAMIAAR